MGKFQSQNSKKTRIKFKFDIKDKSFLKFKWKSPKDQKENEFNLNFDPKTLDTIQIKDNH